MGEARRWRRLAANATQSKPYEAFAKQGLDLAAILREKFPHAHPRAWRNVFRVVADITRSDLKPKPPRESCKIADNFKLAIGVRCKSSERRTNSRSRETAASQRRRLTAYMLRRKNRRKSHGAAKPLERSRAMFSISRCSACENEALIRPKRRSCQ